MSIRLELQERIKEYTTQHPDAVELFKEIWKVINSPLELFCEDEAYFRLENAGVTNPTAERIQSLRKALYDSESFVDADTANNIMEGELYESPVSLEELIQPDEKIREVTLSTGRKVHYIADSQCRNVLECLESERKRLQSIYWDDAVIAEIMGIDLSIFCSGGKDVRTGCGRDNGMLSGCQYCVKYGECEYMADAKQTKDEYTELAFLNK